MKDKTKGIPGYSNLNRPKRKGEYLDYCSRSGAWCWNTDMVTDDYGVRVHKGHNLRKSPRELGLTIPGERQPTLLNGGGNVDLPYRCFIIRDSDGSVIDVFCGNYGDQVPWEPASSNQITFYTPVVNDQTFTINDSETVVGTVSASITASYPLTYEITTNSSNRFFINPTTGEITVIGTVVSGTDYEIIVTVTSTGPGSLSDTATITIEVEAFAYSNYGTMKGEFLNSGLATGFWEDASGNHDLIQTTASWKPTETADVIGSFSGLLFDGSNDFLESEAAASYWNFLHDGTAYAAIFIVKTISNASTTDTRRLANTGNNAAEGIDFVVWDDSSGSNPSQTAQMELNKGGSTNVVTATGAGGELTVGSPHVLVFLHNENLSGTDDAFIYCDGVLIASGGRSTSYGTSDATHTLRIGGTQSGAAANTFLSAYVLEQAFIQGALTEDDIIEITNYKRSQFGF